MGGEGKVLNRLKWGSPPPLRLRELHLNSAVKIKDKSQNINLRISGCKPTWCSLVQPLKATITAILIQSILKHNRNIVVTKFPSDGILTTHNELSR